MITQQVVKKQFKVDTNGYNHGRIECEEVIVRLYKVDGAGYAITIDAPGLKINNLSSNGFYPNSPVKEIIIDRKIEGAI